VGRPLTRGGLAYSFVVGGPENRRDTRFRVHLAVRFASARDFVTEYAENLSNGGLFVCGAHTLAPLSDVQVEIDLPGLGHFTIEGRVAHLLPEEIAARVGRPAGAGIEITRAPTTFRDALQQYLHRLGRRRDSAVLVDGGAMQAALESAGYRASEAPSPDNLVAAVARSELPVLGIIVPEMRAGDYRGAAQAAGVSDLVMTYREIADLGPVLVRLDDQL
jgi:uncharacterized protein (TIGR02266 family)